MSPPRECVAAEDACIHALSLATYRALQGEYVVPSYVLLPVLPPVLLHVVAQQHHSVALCVGTRDSY